MNVPTLRWDFERKMPAELKDTGRKEGAGQITLFDSVEKSGWEEITEKQKYCGVYNHFEQEKGVCVLCEAKRI